MQGRPGVHRSCGRPVGSAAVTGFHMRALRAAARSAAVGADQPLVSRASTALGLPRLAASCARRGASPTETLTVFHLEKSLCGRAVRAWW